MDWVFVLFPPTKLSGHEAVRRSDWYPSLPSEYCARCGVDMPVVAALEDGCPHCYQQKMLWNGVWKLGSYSEPLSEWVKDCKFQNMFNWADYFGKQLAVQSPDYEDAVVTAVPLHWLRRCSRGYDQSRLMARAFARAKNLPLQRLLRRVKRTKQQAMLDSNNQRMLNVRNAFRLRGKPNLTDKTIWLIDDVKTSGATAHSCTRLLLRAGAKRVNLVVTAVAEPKRNL
jgi:ComF family protein